MNIVTVNPTLFDKLYRWEPGISASATQCLLWHKWQLKLNKILNIWYKVEWASISDSHVFLLYGEKERQVKELLNRWIYEPIEEYVYTRPDLFGFELIKENLDFIRVYPYSDWSIDYPLTGKYSLHPYPHQVAQFFAVKQIPNPYPKNSVGGLLGETLPHEQKIYVLVKEQRIWSNTDGYEINEKGESVYNLKWKLVYTGQEALYSEYRQLKLF